MRPETGACQRRAPCLHLVPCRNLHLHQTVTQINNFWNNSSDKVIGVICEVNETWKDKIINITCYVFCRCFLSIFNVVLLPGQSNYPIKEHIDSMNIINYKDINKFYSHFSGHLEHCLKPKQKEFFSSHVGLLRACLAMLSHPSPVYQAGLNVNDLLK